MRRYCGRSAGESAGSTKTSSRDDFAATRWVSPTLTPAPRAARASRAFFDVASWLRARAAAAARGDPSGTSSRGLAARGSAR